MEDYLKYQICNSSVTTGGILPKFVAKVEVMRQNFKKLKIKTAFDGRDLKLLNIVFLFYFYFKGFLVFYILLYKLNRSGRARGCYCPDLWVADFEERHKCAG